MTEENDAPKAVGFFKLVSVQLICCTSDRELFGKQLCYYVLVQLAVVDLAAVLLFG